MATEGILPFSVVSVVEDVIKQHGNRLSDIDLASRKAEEASLRRYEAARWLRKTVGVVAAKDLPAEPSEEDFRLGLRSGIILCNVINKVQPGAVPKVVEAPCDSAGVPDGAALSAYQYFENVRNFLVAVEDMGLPTFEASDLEQGGKSSRIVNCVLALKSYGEWKQGGGNGMWKFGGALKPSSSGKQFVRKNSEPFTNFFTRNPSPSEKSVDSLSCEDMGPDIIEMGNIGTLHLLVRELLSDRKQEEIPIIVENMLTKVMEEFEQRLACQNEQMKSTLRDMDVSGPNNSPLESTSCEVNKPTPRYMDVSGPNKSPSESTSCEIKMKPTLRNMDVSATNKSPLESTSCEINMKPTMRNMDVSGPNKSPSESISCEIKTKPTMRNMDVSATNKSPLESTSCEINMKPTLRDMDVSGPNKSPSESASCEINMKPTLGDIDVSDPNKSTSDSTPRKINMEVRTIYVENDEWIKEREIMVERAKARALKQQILVEQQHKDIQELKNTLDTAKAGMHLLQIKHQEEVNNLGKRLYGLAHAASGYQRVLEENRKLYNQIQDLKGNIRVYCRVRPFLPGQPNGLSSVERIDDGNITITTPAKVAREGRKSFTFNKVFGPSATQEEVFSDTRPLVRSVLDGFNVCIFAYGQTGSGKTFTMSGPKVLTEDTLGVNYRALSDLFLISEQRKETIAYDVSVQMMEIYNEQVRDLLTTDGSNKRLEIKNSTQNGLNVPDANLVRVSTTSDVIRLMDLGQKNRAVSSTAMNDRSSRSHSCVTVHVQGRDLTSGVVLRGCMHLVDLAGSERVDKSEVVGDRLKEAQHINKSLAALGDVISSLAQKNAHVPYRNSKLTQLLQDSLGGQAKTLMFVHISPEPDAVVETISTLKFAERVSTIELGAAKANKDSSDVKELKEQIASLKAALALKEGDPECREKSGSSPDRLRLKSPGDMLGGRRQPMEDVGNIEVKKNSASKIKRQVSDLRDRSTNSPPWSIGGSPVINEGEKAPGPGDWDDKTIDGDWEEDNRLSPEMFYPRHTDPSKIYPEQPSSRFMDASRTTRSDAATTDDSDFEAATSDSSEPDLLWQLNLPKASSVPTGIGSKMKRPSNVKQAKSPDMRSNIPAPASRRLSGGGNSPLQKTGRQPVPADGRRKTGK